MPGVFACLASRISDGIVTHSLHMNKFTALEWFSIHKAGNCAVIELPEVYEPFNIGDDIEVDGNKYMIAGIERFAVSQPKNQVGLLLRRK